MKVFRADGNFFSFELSCGATCAGRENLISVCSVRRWYNQVFSYLKEHRKQQRRKNTLSSGEEDRRDSMIINSWYSTLIHFIIEYRITNVIHPSGIFMMGGRNAKRVKSDIFQSPLVRCFQNAIIVVVAELAHTISSLINAILFIDLNNRLLHRFMRTRYHHHSQTVVGKWDISLCLLAAIRDEKFLKLERKERKNDIRKDEN